jgi:uncharacterized cupin superfamily protein
MNVYGLDWDVEHAPAGAGERLLHIGRRLGGELLGATVFEVDTGWSGLYHLHHGNEEVVVVLEGTPILRLPQGEVQLRPGQAALFRSGAEGAHGLRHDSDRPARFLMVSTMNAPDVGEYLDSGTIAVFAGDAPTAGREAPVEAFFPRDAAIAYSEIPRRPVGNARRRYERRRA